MIQPLETETAGQIYCKNYDDLFGDDFNVKKSNNFSLVTVCQQKRDLSLGSDFSPRLLAWL